MFLEYCVGSENNCSDINDPGPTTTAPEPDPEKVLYHLTQGTSPSQSYIMAKGGQLGSYTYQINAPPITGKNGRGQYMWAWTYTVAPKTGVASRLTACENAGRKDNGAGAALIPQGDARSILNGLVANGPYVDKLRLNDNGGPDGSALAVASMTPVTGNFGPGSYAVKLTGKVRNAEFQSEESFSIAT